MPTPDTGPGPGHRDHHRGGPADVAGVDHCPPHLDHGHFETQNHHIDHVTWSISSAAKLQFVPNRMRFPNFGHPVLTRERPSSGIDFLGKYTVCSKRNGTLQLWSPCTHQGKTKQ